MKSRVRNGSYDLVNSDLQPTPSAIVGSGQCEGTAGFHYKNTWVMSSVGLTTFDGITAINGTVWRTPNAPFVIDYITIKTVTNITGVRVSGPSFSTLDLFLEIDDASGNHAILSKTGLNFSGGTFASGNIFTTVLNPGFALNNFTLNGAWGGGPAGATYQLPIFHANGSGWFNQPLWISMSSEPTSYTLSGTIETHVFGKILS